MIADNKLLIRLSDADNVAVARMDLVAGQSLASDAIALIVRDTIPSGHKLALRTIDVGSPVLKYGQIIGVATHNILPGQHVHTHNVEMVRSTPLTMHCARPSKTISK